MNNLPSGTVTFLFTDIEGSTPLFQTYPEAMPRALLRHHEILNQHIAAQRGRVFNIVGDAFCAAFENAADAVTAAVNAQRALHAEPWQVGFLRVRMGLHTGDAQAQGDDYVSSLTLVRAQRFMSAGHGGQTLLSPATFELVHTKLPPAITVRDLGVQKLRGLTQPEHIYQVNVPDLPDEFPPLRVVEQVNATEPGAMLEQLVRHKLVGRSSELAQLQQHWNQTQQGRAHLILLSGEPGVGKTRLADELIERAARDGAEILRGGCYEFEATTPYLPFVEAFRDWTHVQDADHLSAMLGATASEMAKLAPEIEIKLGAQAINPPLSPNEERLRLFDHIARFLQNLAAPHGLLLFLDDLHWADQGTLNLLHYLLRRVRNERILILAAYREVELDRTHPLATSLVEWYREHLATRIALPRLSRQDTGALLASLFGQASISDEFAQVLYRETEGNPFFIEEVIKSLIEQGQIYRAHDSWERKQLDELAIPQSVKEAIGRRLNRLSDPCVDMLRTAAALGKIFPFAELSSAATAPEDDLLDALDEASAAQLIRANPDDTFAFTHDKIREVLYEEINPIRRRRLHQRIGEGLEKLYPHPNGHTSDLAYHFTQSGDLKKSLDYSLRAAQAAARVFALDDALKFYEQAHESAEALQRVDALAQIDEAMGDMYRQRGEITTAVTRYEHAYAHVTTTAEHAALHVKIGLAYSPIGDTRGIEALQQALTELDPQTQSLQLAFALALIGRHHHYHTEHYQAIEYFERARAIAEPLDDAPTLETVYSFLAGAYQHLMRYESSNAWSQKCIALGERKQYPEAVALGYEFMAENAFGQGFWDDTIRFSLRNREIGLRIGSLARVGWADYAYTLGLHGQGDLRAARQVALAGLGIAEQLGENRLATWFEPELARILMDLGEPELAQTYAARGLVRSQALGQIVLQSWAVQGQAYLHLWRGEFQAAAALYEASLLALQASENRAVRNPLGAYAAMSLLYSGRVSDAETTAQSALELAQAANTPHYVALAQYAQGQIWNVQGKRDAAHTALDQAIAIFEQYGTRIEWARALEYRAALLRASGQLDTADAAQARAAALLAECGAVHYALGVNPLS